MNRVAGYLGFVSASCVMLAGCSGGHDHEGHSHSQSSPATSGHAAHAHDDRDHEPGPHGGAVFHLTDSTHGELVLDPATGAVALYILGLDLGVISLSDPLTAEVRLTVEDAGGPVEIELRPPDDADLAFSHLEAMEPALRGREALTGRLSGRLRLQGELTTIGAMVYWPAEEHAEHDDH